MDISHLDNLNLKNVEYKIINLINEYKESIEKYELDFFKNLPDYIDERYLNLYYDYNFTNLFKDNISLYEKVRTLEKLDIEIFDIKNNIAITVKYTDESYFFKWNMFKSDNYENNINTTAIRIFKHFMLVSKKNLERETDIFVFTLDEIINIATSNYICLHCILKDYINNIKQKNDFVKQLAMIII